MIKNEKKPFVLVISGPTGCGKTDLAEKIASLIPAQIINADVGQFYSPLSIGTAKPDWKNSPIKQHLFDVLDKPEDLTIFKFYNLVLEKINEISSKGELPIVAGGSFFYLKSLYFPAKLLEKNQSHDLVDLEKIPEKDLWEALNKIDPKRASVLHKNDIYRIKRALEIWCSTGVKPSEYEPKFDPKFNSLFIFINQPKEILHERIDKRAEIMIKQGWINEAQKLVGTNWEPFVRYKGLIGYPEIFDWLTLRDACKACSSGRTVDTLEPFVVRNEVSRTMNGEDLKKLIEIIQTRTKQYAKKQLTFWRGLKKQLELNKEKSRFECKILEVDKVSENVVNFIKSTIP